MYCISRHVNEGFASSVSAQSPAASGAEADVPENGPLTNVKIMFIHCKCDRYCTIFNLCGCVCYTVMLGALLINKIISNWLKRNYKTPT